MIKSIWEVLTLVDIYDMTIIKSHKLENFQNFSLLTFKGITYRACIKFGVINKSIDEHMGSGVRTPSLQNFVLFTVVPLESR